MAIILVNDKTLEVSVRVKVDEEFKPNEELKNIEEKGKILQNRYKELIKEVTEFIKECETWNKENNSK